MSPCNMVYSILGSFGICIGVTPNLWKLPLQPIYFACGLPQALPDLRPIGVIFEPQSILGCKEFCMRWTCRAKTLQSDGTT